MLLEGRTILGETAQRPVRVCGAGAFVVLKALAFHIRGENKDAYDLLYMLRNFGRGVSDVVEQFRPLLPDASAGKALELLANRFPGCGGYWTEARCGIPIRTAGPGHSGGCCGLCSPAAGRMRDVMNESEQSKDVHRISRFSPSSERRSRTLSPRSAARAARPRWKSQPAPPPAVRQPLQAKRPLSQKPANAGPPSRMRGSKVIILQ